VPQTSLHLLLSQLPSFSRLAYVDLNLENEPAPAPATGSWLQGIAREANERQQTVTAKCARTTYPHHVPARATGSPRRALSRALAERPCQSLGYPARPANHPLSPQGDQQVLASRHRLELKVKLDMAYSLSLPALEDPQPCNGTHGTYRASGVRLR
jgi:hypothetical protein